MKQLLEMFLMDIKMNFKGFMGTYMIIVPLVILLVLQGFLPTVENTKPTIAVVSEGENSVEAAIIDELRTLGDVLEYKTVEKMEQKLRGSGSAEGLYWDPEAGQYVSVMERNIENNQTFSLASRIIRQYYYNETYTDTQPITTLTSSVPEELSGRTEISPVASMGGAIFLVFMIIITGFMIGLGIVYDKEGGTDRALQVSPVSKSDYFIGKSLFPLLIILIYTIIALYMLKLQKVDILQAYTMAVLSFPVTLLFGLLLGSLAHNENEAIGIGKMMSMLVMLSILGGTLLPDTWHWVVWWSPFYWLYNALETVFTQTAAWRDLGWKAAVIIGLSLVFFLLLRKKIVKGLSSN